MRCPDCNKFVSYDEPEAEVQSVEVSGTTVTTSVRVVMKCADCGTELKDNDFDTEVEINHECEAGATINPEFKDGDEQFELESDGDAQGESRVATLDRRGKPIKNPRYMKTFYGFSLEPEVKCYKCNAIFTVEVKDENQASGFNECC